MINLKPIESTSETLVVGAGSFGGVELLQNLNFTTMGENGEMIKLGLQAVIAVATLVKFLRTNKKNKSKKD